MMIKTERNLYQVSS